ncbi:MAG: hypothetical protein ACOY82_17655 [Pseudomonadota bacterium]
MRILIHSMLVAAFGLGVPQLLHAQSGGIGATPNPVIVPPGGSVGNTDVYWTVSGGEAFYITVNCGGGDGLFASSGAGSYSQSAPWIAVGANCVFSLRANSPGGPVLGSVAVNGVATNGAISAAPETVVIPAGQTHGNTNIGWVGEYADSFHVTVNCGGGDGLFASSGPGGNSQSAPWIGVGSQCLFSLRADSPSGPVLDSVAVNGVAGQAPSGSISAAPTTINLAAGQSSGSTTLSWNGQNASAFVVTRDCGAGESGFTSSGPGSYSQVASGIAAGATCTFRLRADSASGTVLGSTNVNAVAAPSTTGTISASPSTVSIPAGQSTGTTTLNWTAQGGSNVHVLVSCGGGPESLFASSGMGSYSQSAPWITVGANCAFRLRAGTTTGPLLATANVVGVVGQAPTGSISASPTTVNIPSGQSTGSSTISWTTSGVSQAHVRSSCAGAAQTGFAVTGPGNFSQVANFIPVGASCTFQLRADSAGGALLGSVTVAGQQAISTITTHRGGSNHLFYRHPTPGGAGGYGYGIALHYHEPGVRSTVQNQLQQMYANGQRSLRVFVHYLHAPGGTTTDTPAESSRKCRVEVKDAKTCPAGSEYFLPLQYQQNLASYLADIRAAGFERVLVAIGPQWINDFYGCASSQIPDSIRQQLYAGSPLVNELFEESWGVAKETRAIAVASGLPYLMDLGNEYIPPSNLTGCAKDIIEGTATTQGYLRFMWSRYVANYGTQDTVGFSVIVGNGWDADNRLARMPQFLSPLPAVYSLHSYTASGDIYGGLRRAYTVTGNFGRRPWIIGETDSRSTTAANELRRFVLDTPQQQVLYALQWPGFNCTTEAECLPLDFSTFISRGF